VEKKKGNKGEKRENFNNFLIISQARAAVALSAAQATEARGPSC
jgi:hypothetical protein